MWQTADVAIGPNDETGEKILDAVIRVWQSFGVKRISIDMIAREAGVSHMSLYRRWPGKNDLIMAAGIREVERIMERCDERVAAVGSDEDAVVESFTTLYCLVRSHPLYIREMTTEPEGILPYVTILADPAIRMGVEYGVGLRDWKDPPENLPEVVELGVRVVQSLLLTPPTQISLDTEDEVRAYARRVLVPLYRRITDQQWSAVPG